MAGDRSANVRAAVAQAADIGAENADGALVGPRSGGALLGGGAPLQPRRQARSADDGRLNDGAGLRGGEPVPRRSGGGAVRGRRSVRVRAVAAARLDAGRDVLETLAGDPDDSVRAAVAANPAAPGVAARSPGP